MIFTRRIFFLLLGCAWLAACSILEAPAAPAPMETESLVSLPGATETPTTVWFPASPTPSAQPYATHTATPEMRPGIGGTTLSDSFTDEDLWDTATSDKGTASVDRNRLTLAIKPEGQHLSLRHDLTVSDFYAEITARPSLCRGADEYGVLIRANAVAYYRFGLACNGTVRAERISVGTRETLQEPIASGDAPRGSPGEVRIGVWASGSEMRLFLNGRYQFTIRNSNYRTGTIGVFARAAGNTPVTVNFSDLVIQDVAYAPPTRAPVP